MQRAQSAPPSAVAHAAGGLGSSLRKKAKTLKIWTAWRNTHHVCVAWRASAMQQKQRAPPAQNSVHRLVFLGVAILGIVLVVQLLQHIPEMCCDAALEVCIVQRPA